MSPELLDYPTIQAAIAGNPIALQAVLDYYEPYMITLLKTEHDTINPEALQEIKIELIKAVLKWKPLKLQ